MSEINKEGNYFEFYGLPVQFNPDQALVKAKFYELSKKYHPDFFANESAEKQEEVLALSTLNNKAYQTLSQPKRCLKYVLELKNLLADNENYNLPPSFLMEMMDVNEALMDLELTPNADKLAALKTEINTITQNLNQQLQSLTMRFDKDSDTNEALLVEIKDVFYRQKYLDRIEENLRKN